MSTPISTIYQRAVDGNLESQASKDKEAQDKAEKNTLNEAILRDHWIKLAHSIELISKLRQQRDKILQLAQQSVYGDLATNDYMRARLVEAETVERVINLITNGKYER